MNYEEQVAVDEMKVQIEAAQKFLWEAASICSENPRLAKSYTGLYLSKSLTSILKIVKLLEEESVRSDT